MPLRELKFESNSNVSLDTLRRILRQNNIRKWRAAQRPRLTLKHVAARFQWSKDNKDNTDEQWRRIIWSDECSVEKGKDPRQVWVFRRPGEAEKFKPQNVVPKEKGKGVSLMVWGCFAGNIRGPLVSYEGVNNAATNIATLHDHLLPFIDSLPEAVKNDVIYQQDNATIHTAKATLKYLEDNAISVMKWPPISPDMNPIEHIWGTLKAKLHSMFPDTYCIRGGPDTVHKELNRRLQVVWDALEAEVFDVLVSSMRRRCNALYEAQGWYTKY